MSLKACEHFANIASIKTAQGEIVADPKQIIMFSSFCSHLYSSEVTPDDSKSDPFFCHLSLPKLSPNQVLSLEKPMSLEELETALRSMNKGKSPGFDGIPPEFILFVWP